MKTFTYLFVLVIILITIHGKLEAQNQSILLPFSGDTYPTATGSKMINFTNSLNPIVESLPRFTFTVYDPTIPGNRPGNPHDVSDLHAPATDPNNIYLFNEKYLGQHPMFAQQVVHDKDGRISEQLSVNS